MSFQTNRSADAYQTHFVRWSNTRQERNSILSAAPGGTNFDSYSIRYAAELLKKRQEAHKLLCVISDGLPSHYFAGESGIRENVAAIEDARILGIDVFGAGIGKLQTEKFVQMYGKDFYMQIEKPDDLVNQMAGLIKTIVKGW